MLLAGIFDKLLSVVYVVDSWLFSTDSSVY